MTVSGSNKAIVHDIKGDGTVAFFLHQNPFQNLLSTTREAGSKTVGIVDATSERVASHAAHLNNSRDVG